MHTFQGAETNPLEKMEWRIRVIPSVILKKSEQEAAETTFIQSRHTTSQRSSVQQDLGQSSAWDLYFQWESGKTHLKSLR